MLYLTCLWGEQPKHVTEKWGLPGDFCVRIINLSQNWPVHQNPAAFVEISGLQVVGKIGIGQKSVDDLENFVASQVLEDRFLWREKASDTQVDTKLDKMIIIRTKNVQA